MAQSNIFRHISIDVFSATPKYVQVSQSIIKAISETKIAKGDLLPSINELSYEYDISRDTAEKAYRYLKKIGVLGSVPGKGYFVKSENVKSNVRIFLLFNKLSSHKKIIYDAFVKTLGSEAMIDFYVYNNDFNLFKKLIKSAEKNYSHFVIITHFLDSGESAFEILNTLPKEKLILLDKLVPGVTGECSAVYENFEEDIYNALEKMLPQLRKYNTLKIIVPQTTYFPEEITKGFKTFCHQYAFDSKVVHTIATEKIEANTTYISLMEDDLVTLVEKISGSNLKIGKEVGVISYNETPIKRIIQNGITTISTDFEMMGIQAAQLILKSDIKQVAIPFHVRLRPSL